jgi:hypothetical protein
VVPDSVRKVIEEERAKFAGGELAWSPTNAMERVANAAAMDIAKSLPNGAWRDKIKRDYPDAFPEARK